MIFYQVELRNVELKPSAFDVLAMPIRVKRGVVGHMKLKVHLADKPIPSPTHVQIPWRNLGGQPVQLEMSQLNILLQRGVLSQRYSTVIGVSSRPPCPSGADAEIVEAWLRASKKQRLASFEAAHTEPAETSSDGSFTANLTMLIFNNLQARPPRLLFPLIGCSADQHSRSACPLRGHRCCHRIPM